MADDISPHLDAATLASLEDLAPTEETTPRRVIVLGAGMAGLTAALQLQRGGHEVTVVEARQRPGGRVHSIRDPFADGMRAEAGAQYVPSNHVYTIKYVEELGLELEWVNPAHLHDFFYVGGQRVRLDAGEVTWPISLSEDEQKLGFEGMYEKYWGELERSAGDGSDPTYPQDQSLWKYDAMTTEEVMLARGASPAAAELLRVSTFHSFGDSGRNLSALAELQRCALVPGKEHGDVWRVFRDGTDALPEGLAKKLTSQIHYGREVLEIAQDEEGVTVTTRHGDTEQVFHGDFVVCTIPFPVLADVEFSPPLSPAKQRTIRSAKGTPLAHAFIQVRNRTWLERDYGLHAIGFTDLPLGMIRDTTHNQPGQRGILNAYMTGEDANTVLAMPLEERNAYVVTEFEKIFPGVAQEVEEIVWHDWAAEPYSRGSYIHFEAGEYAALWPHVAATEERIYFAGDHTSYRRGWMDGAIASAHAVAREIHTR